VCFILTINDTFGQLSSAVENGNLPFD